MQNNSYFISSLLGLSLFPSLTWADTKSTNVLSVITLQAEDQQENATTISAVTKFAHDVMDVPFSRSFLSEEILRQQDIQRIDEAIQLVNGVYAQNNYGGGFWDN